MKFGAILCKWIGVQTHLVSNQENFYIEYFTFFNMFLCFSIINCGKYYISFLEIKPSRKTFRVNDVLRLLVLFSTVSRKQIVNLDLKVSISDKITDNSLLIPCDNQDHHENEIMKQHRQSCRLESSPIFFDIYLFF